MILIRAIEIFLKLTLCLSFKRFFWVRLVLFPLHLVFVPVLVFVPYHKRMRLCLQSLGVVFVKLGQSLSLKSFLFSRETLMAFSYLQDEVPPMKKGLFDVLKVQNVELLEIKSIKIEEKPIASASVAQVHVGFLGKKKVAVKIVRIGIKEQIEKDFKVVFIMLGVVSKFISPAFQIVDVAKDIHCHLMKEIDLENERYNLQKMKGSLVSDAKMQVPSCFVEFSNSNVLVMDFIEGISLRRVIYDRTLKVNRSTVAVNVVQTYLNQVYRDGVFHADMHAGNVFVKENGDIALVDFGLVCEISLKDRRAVATMIYAFLRQNYELVLKTQLRAGYIDERVYYDYGYRCAMKKLTRGFAGKFDMSVFTQELFKAMHDYNVFVPKHLLMLNKTILYVEDVTKQLEPFFEPFRVMSPWIGSWYKKQRVLMFLEGVYYKIKA